MPVPDRGRPQAASLHQIARQRIPEGLHSDAEDRQDVANRRRAKVRRADRVEEDGSRLILRSLPANSWTERQRQLGAPGELRLVARGQAGNTRALAIRVPIVESLQGEAQPI